MKRFIKLFICAMLSIIIQCGVLLYLDKVLLKESSEFTSEKVDITVKSVDTDVSIPTNAEKIQVSFNGRYITYFIDNKLMIINTKTAEVKQILANTEILDTEWVPNNNIMLVVENLSGKLNVKTYNASNGVEQPVKEISNYQKSMQVNAFISSSTEYISVNRGKSTDIYRIDINNDMKVLDEDVSVLGSAKVFWDEDVFIYGDALNKNFYRYTNGKNTKLNLGNTSNLVLLAATNSKMYMGELSGEKIVKIIYGDDQTNISTWKTEILEKPKDIKDIYIDDKSEILVNDNLQGKVKNITTGDTITYEGKFISVNDKVVCSSDNGKIYLKSTKDVDKKQ
ncbi:MULTISPECIES: hypothetical protein [Clostridium]|uniref:Dipeptidyl-peptidase IV n=1 Tax=Clostridium cibarium TaxID=2762247 RepID=A0ABR8PR21_9CLOT|nr:MULTISPECIES: hypothetical protein [Clostridium]MBD7910607.1 hypothetical protein [Clostridium cibarium]